MLLILNNGFHFQSSSHPSSSHNSNVFVVLENKFFKGPVQRLFCPALTSKDLSYSLMQDSSSDLAVPLHFKVAGSIYTIVYTINPFLSFTEHVWCTRTELRFHAHYPVFIQLLRVLGDTADRSTNAGRTMSFPQDEARTPGAAAQSTVWHSLGVLH